MKKHFTSNKPLMQLFLGVPLLAALSLAQAHAAAILNGDFEAGNTGFSSGHIYVTPGPNKLVPEGVYTVDDNPFDSHPSFFKIDDHTPGAGVNMMIVNGSVQFGKSVWEGSSTVSLELGEKYDFSAWVASVNPTNPAVLTFKVGATDIGTLSPDDDGTWKRLFGTFIAGEKNPTFSLLNANTAAGGNDFAIDDINIFFAGTTTPPTDPPSGVPETGSGLMGMLTLVALCGFRFHRNRAGVSKK